MNDMLKYELKKYILKPSVIICLAVLLLVNLVKVLEIYCQGSGRQILFSGKGRIEISKDVLYEKYGGEITQEKIESLKAELAVAEQKLEEYGIIEEPIENTYTGYPYGDVNLIKDIIFYTNTHCFTLIHQMSCQTERRKKPHFMKAETNTIKEKASCTNIALKAEPPTAI